MGSQVPFMLANPNMEAKSQILSLKEPLNKSSQFHQVFSWKSIALFDDPIHELEKKTPCSLVAKATSSLLCTHHIKPFQFDPTLNASPKPHLQKSVIM